MLTLGFIFGVCFYENVKIKHTFSLFKESLLTLYDKAEAENVTYDDGTAIEKLWENQKKTLHIWLPHTAILEIDYQLYEAVGYLYVRDYKSAMPKIEILLAMCVNIPQSYRFSLENIL